MFGVILLRHGTTGEGVHCVKDEYILSINYMELLAT